VLREKAGRSLLPIFVAQGEGQAIAAGLGRGPATSREEGTGLLASSLSALGARLLRVELDLRPPARFSARVIYVQGGRRVAVAARPSDAVALAVGPRAPIYATRAVMEKAALSPADVSRMHREVDRDAEDPPAAELEL
jgi:bifunctional DNase/RNase